MSSSRPALTLLVAAALAAIALLPGCPGGGAGGDASGAASVAAAGGERHPTPFEVARGSTLHRILDRKQLVVGMEVEFWPFEYDDGSGAPQGFDVDLARLLAEALGVELSLRDIEWAGLIPSLLDGKVDVVISGMTATLERARTVSFSEPYFRTGLAILAGRERGAAIRGPADLDRPGVILALKTGTTGHLVAEKRFPSAEKRFFKDEAACALEVAQGRADAFVYDQVSVAKHARLHPETTRALLEPFTYEPFAIATRQGEADLLRFLDQLLRTAREDGRLAALERRHLGDIRAPGKEGR